LGYSGLIQLRAGLDSRPNPIFPKDREGRMLFSNPASHAAIVPLSMSTATARRKVDALASLCKARFPASVVVCNDGAGFFGWPTRLSAMTAAP